MILVDQGTFSIANENSLHANDVTIEWFNRLTHSFGRFFSKTEAPQAYQLMKLLAETQWFHGEILRSPDAEDRLRGREVGTFLLRTRHPFG